MATWQSSYKKTPLTPAQKLLGFIIPSVSRALGAVLAQWDFLSGLLEGAAHCNDFI